MNEYLMHTAGSARTRKEHPVVFVGFQRGFDKRARLIHELGRLLARAGGVGVCVAVGRQNL
jgi:hypothetical protein